VQGPDKVYAGKRVYREVSCLRLDLIVRVYAYTPATAEKPERAWVWVRYGEHTVTAESRASLWEVLRVIAPPEPAEPCQPT